MDIFIFINTLFEKTGDKIIVYSKTNNIIAFECEH